MESGQWIRSLRDDLIHWGGSPHDSGRGSLAEVAPPDGAVFALPSV